MKNIEKLKKQLTWVNWNYQLQDNKETKVPISFKNKVTGTNEKYKDTWGTYEDVSNNKNANGIGLVFNDGICGIDIDKRSLTDTLTQEIINLFNTYTEISPSGNGIHILFKVDLKKLPSDFKSKYLMKNTQLGIEQYVSGITNRYFTFTGNSINEYDIEERSNEFMIFCDTYMKKDTLQTTLQSEYKTSLSKEKILENINKSSQKDKFHKLYYMGDFSDFNNDESSAEMSLCDILAFYCQGDYEMIESILKDSIIYRDKWDKHKTYLRDTIYKAINGCDSFYGMKKVKDFSIEVLKKYLSSKGITIKYNSITKEVEVTGNIDNHNTEHLLQNLHIILYDKLKSVYKRVSKVIIKDYLDVIATDNAYNPVLDLINSTKWDKKDRFKELISILHLENDSLSQILIKKWLMQGYALLQNTLESPFGADGVLVIQGEQAIGKTTLARKLAIEDRFFKEGLYLQFNDKDTIRRCCSYWIAELGEIETTLKSDIEKLKAFVTNNLDQYRLPYGSTDTKLPRKTNLIGTCNSDKFLIDTTGNRRFWTIKVSSIDLDRLKNFNSLQLWCQSAEEVGNNLQTFRLTPEELKLLEKRNKEHEKPLKGEQEVRDILSLDYELKEVSTTEFMEAYPVLEKFNAQNIGKVLNKLGYEARAINNGKKNVRLLPMP